MSKPTPNTETSEMVAVYQFLEPGELIQAGDECPDDNAARWEPVPSIFFRCAHSPLFKTVRRRVFLPTLDAAEQRASSDVKVKELEDCLRDILRGEYEAKHRYGLTDCIDNSGRAYQSQYLADCLKRAEELLGVSALQNGGGDA